MNLLNWKLTVSQEHSIATGHGKDSGFSCTLNWYIVSKETMKPMHRTFYEGMEQAWLILGEDVL